MNVNQRTIPKMPKAIILVAGEGIRLRPYTNDKPKCLVEIDGLSLLERQLKVLNHSHINQIILIGGYCIEKIKRLGIEYRENKRYAETNMLWTLLTASDELKGDILVCYGDIVYSKEILQELLASQADISIVIDMNWENYWRARNEDPLSDAESLKLSKDGQILEIGQRPNSISEIEGQYIGLIKFNNNGIVSFLKTFEAARKTGNIRGKSLEKAYMTDMFQHMIDLGIRINAVKVYDDWVEVDTVEDLKNHITRLRLKKIDESTI